MHTSLSTIDILALSGGYLYVDQIARIVGGSASVVEGALNLQPACPKRSCQSAEYHSSTTLTNISDLEEGQLVKKHTSTEAGNDQFRLVTF